MKSKLQRRFNERTWRSPDFSWFAGVDVSKDHLDLCLMDSFGKLRQRRFENGVAGFEQLVAWCATWTSLKSVHFCMEATGAYSFGLASHLAGAGLLVSVENPRLIKAHGISERIQNKTDKADASVIADYCRAKAPKAWALADPVLREIDLLAKRLRDLEHSKQSQANRLEDPYLPESVAGSIRRTVQWHEEEAKIVIQAIEALLCQRPELRTMIHALVGEPGVGELTALRVLCHLGWNVDGFESAQQAAAFAGLNPVLAESGSSIGKTRISKRGDPGIRASLHMATLTAIIHNPRIKAFYQKLLSKGKSKMSAITACSRKLLMILFGILKAHLSQRAPIYSGEKRRYQNLSGSQRVYNPKIWPTALTS